MGQVGEPQQELCVRQYWPLSTRLVSAVSAGQCPHLPCRYAHQQSPAYCDRMPAFYSGRQPFRPCSYPALWASPHGSHSICFTNSSLQHLRLPGQVKTPICTWCNARTSTPVRRSGWITLEHGVGEQFQT